MTTSPDLKPLRADAERNRLRLIETAAAAFAAHGQQATVAEITSEAGVGKGTFFRNFPTKESLVAAVVHHRLVEIVNTGRSLLDHADPDEALREFMRAGVLLQSSDRCLLEVAGGSVFNDDNVKDAHDEIYQITKDLVDRAQRHGTLRRDVTADDILLLECAASRSVAHLRHTAPDLWQRYLDVIFDGLRDEAAHPLSVPPPNTNVLAKKDFGSTDDTCR